MLVVSPYHRLLRWDGSLSLLIASSFCSLLIRTIGGAQGADALAVAADPDVYSTNTSELIR